MKPSLRGFATSVIVVFAVAAAGAQSTGGPYTLRKQAIASGGGRATASTYVASVTLAEPIASAIQNGSPYRLTGGFHGPGMAASPRIFCDGFEGAPCL